MNQSTFSGVYDGNVYNNETGYPRYKFTDETTLGKVFTCTETDKVASKTNFSNTKLISQKINDNYLYEYTYDDTFKDQIKRTTTTIGNNVSNADTTYNE